MIKSKNPVTGSLFCTVQVCRNAELQVMSLSYIHMMIRRHHKTTAPVAHVHVHTVQAPLRSAELCNEMPEVN